MRYNALRLELAGILADSGGERKPALRRSRRADRMYATDLAGAPEGPARDAAAGRLREAGWGAFGPEAACVRALLERHPERGEEDCSVECRLVKAGEEGPEAYEQACREIHGMFAERLRRKEKLPKISPAYFGGRTEEKSEC